MNNYPVVWHLKIAILLIIKRYYRYKQLNSKLLFFFAFLFSSQLLYSQSVVVSEYFNTASARDEWTELLVTQDDVNMTGWTLRDDIASQAAWNIPITFVNPASDPNFWNHMRIGTVIVIWHRQVDGAGVAHATDYNKADGYLQVYANDPNYLSGGDLESRQPGQD